MNITSKGQVTIPQELRELMGFLPNTEVEFLVEKGRVYLCKVEQQSKRTQSLIEKMRGKGNIRMTTDEILTLTRGKK